MKNILLLGSKSASRKFLLKEATIPFKIVDQQADESACDWGLPLRQLVEQIALYKMDHVILPAGKEGDICFVLTADTLSQDKDGTIQGKPVDEQDAIAKIKSARDGARLCTSFCLDKKVFQSGAWQVKQRIQRAVHADYVFAIPDEWIKRYMQHSPALNVSHAIAVEEYGAQFLQSVHGSYTAIIGLPMFELRQALEQIGFFSTATAG